MKYKKGDLISHDGTYGRVVWEILDTKPGWYRARMMEKGPRHWRRIRNRDGNPFWEESGHVDVDFRPLSEMPEKWSPCKDPIGVLKRMAKPLH